MVYLQDVCEAINSAAVDPDMGLPGLAIYLVKSVCEALHNLQHPGLGCNQTLHWLL